MLRLFYIDSQEKGKTKYAVGFEMDKICKEGIPYQNFNIVGHGRTKEQAIKDLKNQYDILLNMLIDFKKEIDSI